MIFRKRLRDEIKFESLKELADQMELDKQPAIAPAREIEN